MRADSEERLIDRCRAGDAACYGELVQIHQDKVFNMLYRMLGNYEDARDATQETFLKAYKAIKRFRSDSNFSTWLYRIALNTAHSMGRKQGISPQTVPLDPRPGNGHDAIGHACEAPNPVDAAADSEEKDIVHNALQRLSFDHRRIVVLHDIEGRDYSEIAEILACPMGTVKSKLHRARLMLRKEIEQRLEGFNIDAAESGAG